MAKYLVETYYTCNIKVSHYLDDISEKSLKNLEKQKILIKKIIKILKLLKMKKSQ